MQNLVPEQRQAQEQKAEREARRTREKNADLLGYLGASPSPCPEDEAATFHTVFEADMETYLTESWPAWDQHRQELIDEGEGFGAKNAATYRAAARTAATTPPFLLHALLENVRAMA
ncbi:hypothetical protein [Streptomyces sp. NPDC049906]|uniref:hypothetical protein n=1 Tax=Streptomyces sp. NPDC049906 TaxID=3155656 RepID=UPI00341F1A5F